MSNQQAGNIRRAAEAAAAWESRREELVRLYLIEKWSQTTIAAHYGVTQGALQKVFLRLGIPSRGRGRKGAENGRFVHGMSSTLYRKVVPKEQCAVCGTTHKLCIHHKDENHLNNTPSNLVVLCMTCHSSMHEQAWWDAQNSRS